MEKDINWGLKQEVGFWSPELEFGHVHNGDQEILEEQLYEMGISTEDSEKTPSEHKEVQTEAWTAESASNTDEDWVLLMQSNVEYAVKLAKQYETMRKSGEADQLKHEEWMKQLELKKEDALRQRQGLDDKIKSLQVKLQLNCHKTTRNNFAIKKAELSSERDRLKEESSRLCLELGDVERRLKLLVEEKSEEQQTLRLELSELHKEMNRLKEEYDEANKVALRDEVTSVNMQREAATAQVEDWLADAERHLSLLRSDVSQQGMQQRLDWENKVASVRSVLGNMQRQFNEHVQLLQQGQQLDSLPPVAVPPLPPMPMLDLTLGSRMHPSPQLLLPTQMPPRLQVVPMAFPPQQQTPLAASQCEYTRVSPQPGMLTHQPVSLKNPVSRGPSPPKPAPVAPHAPATAEASQPSTTMLVNLLKTLGAHFPQCSRNQLMNALQQIKTSRGTMAGLSMDELTHQVAQRLAQRDNPASSNPLGPIGPPRHVQHPPQGSPAPQVFHMRSSQTGTPVSRKPCLVCQNPVDAGSQHGMNCSHIVHKECISMWLQTSRNNSCPFCPSK